MKTILQINGTRKEDLDRGLVEAGLIPISFDEPTPENEIVDLVGTLSPEDRRRMANGELRFDIKSRTEFATRNGTVTVIDFDTVKNQKFKSDPLVIIEEITPGTLTPLVNGIAKDAIKVDIVKSAALSMDSDGFKTSVMDLARITGEDPNVVYAKCVKVMIKSFTVGLKRLDMMEERISEKESIIGERIEI